MKQDLNILRVLGNEVETPDDLQIVGRINGIYGVKGWVKVFSETQPRENILKYSPWFLNWRGKYYQVNVTAGRPQSKTLIASLADLEDRDLAAQLNGAVIGVSRSSFAKLEDGEFYWADLEGLTVETLKGETLGTVDHLFETGANDVMVVNGDRERLLPFLYERVIIDIDISAGKILVDWDPDF